MQAIYLQYFIHNKTSVTRARLVWKNVRSKLMLAS